MVNQNATARLDAVGCEQIWGNLSGIECGYIDAVRDDVKTLWLGTVLGQNIPIAVGNRDHDIDPVANCNLHFTKKGITLRGKVGSLLAEPLEFHIVLDKHGSSIQKRLHPQTDASVGRKLRFKNANAVSCGDICRP